MGGGGVGGGIASTNLTSQGNDKSCRSVNILCHAAVRVSEGVDEIRLRVGQIQDEHRPMIPSVDREYQATDIRVASSARLQQLDNLQR